MQFDGWAVWLACICQNKRWRDYQPIHFIFRKTIFFNKNWMIFYIFVINSWLCYYFTTCMILLFLLHLIVVINQIFRIFLVIKKISILVLFFSIHKIYVQKSAWKPPVSLEMGKNFEPEPSTFFEIFWPEKFGRFCTDKVQKRIVGAS